MKPTQESKHGPAVVRYDGDMAFIQIIEFKTKRIDEVTAAVEEYVAKTEGTSTVVRGTQTKDRDAADTYLQLVEFPSYEEAMKNSNSPETSALAEKMGTLCDGPPIFRNLDVLTVMER